MNTPRTAFLALLLFAISSLSACVSDDLSSTSSGVNGRPFFELFEGRDGDMYFNLAAANHEVVLSSQGYGSRASALAGILSVLDNAGNSESFELREARDGQYYFVLRAANGQTIGRSELYVSRSNATRGIVTTMDVVDTYLAFLATRTGARFTVLEGQNGLYYFNLKAANGEIVLKSQAYVRHADALNGAFAVVEAGQNSANYQIRTSADGGAYFNLRSGNNEIIGTSEIYHSASNARRARNALMALLPEVEIL